MFSFKLMFYFSYQFTKYNDFITQILSEIVNILPYISPDFFFWEGVFAPREISSVRVITLYPACDVAHIRVENIKRATYLCEYDVLFIFLLTQVFVKFISNRTSFGILMITFFKISILI